MKDKKLGVKPKDLKKGFVKGDHNPKDKHSLDEGPLNNTFYDEGDGGFLGRAKGWER